MKEPVVCSSHLCFLDDVSNLDNNSLNQYRLLMIVGRTFIRLAAVICLVGVLPTGTAQGYSTTGCRFDPGGFFTSSGRITFRLSNVTSSWSTPHHSAANRWNTTTNAPDIVATGSNLANIWVYDDSYAATWAGLHTGSCPWGSYTWGSNQTKIEYNLNPSSGFPFGTTSTIRQAIATHEMGHAWGLGHTPNSCAVKSVMNDWAGWVHANCTSPGTSPWADDANGKNSLY